VTEGVAEVQCLANVFLVGILLHNALLHVHGVGQHLLQLLQIGVIQVEIEQFCPMLLIGDEAVLEHLGIARANVLIIERTQEFCVEDDEARVVEHADLVF